MVSNNSPAFGGVTDPAFAPVKDAFAANFDANAPFPELGAAVSVFLDGRCVVDLWGGVADAATSRPWAPDTLVNVWSTTKGVMALALARLVGDGLLSYDAPVARYWPEFAAAGKGEATVGQALSHQIGLNGFAEETTVEDFGDWDLVTGRLARQAPFWPPGTDTSYHAMTYGFLAGEIARRVTGSTPRDLIADLFAGPLDLDLQIGVMEAHWSRIAPLTPPPESGADVQIDSIALKGVLNPALAGDTANRADWRRAQIPAGNGHATARSLAKLWGAVANGGELDGVRVLSPESINAMQVVRSDRPDRLLGAGDWGAGVMINRDSLFGPGPRAFGHCGWGGSFGYADPDLRIGVGYTPNRMFGSILHDPRGVALGQVISDCARRV
ncbi:serine hydrolase [Phenylobacterium sp. Root700]|uniref:serine hydrolase domain-containing protein n=1 Tax=Phenylobacterium sp. Root700 TaxID=1736591 RepID=UPI0006F9F68D|nr:serine hydrolase domain-containing protein [Phenylobacterium sp. Root700]KRB52661.1 hypothetical protein ASE02_11805 [Phenylobacterium sp. Root700]